MNQVTARNIDIDISGMHCAGCVSKVQRALEATPGVEQAAVNLAAARARIAFDPDRTSPAGLAAAIDGSGFHAEPAQLDFRVEGMHCATCVGQVENAVEGIEEILSAQANLATSSLRVTVFGSNELPGRIIASLERSGYLAHLNDVSDQADAKAHNYTDLKAILEVSFCAVVSIIFMADMIGMMTGQGWLGAGWQLALTLPVQLLAFKSFGLPAWRALRHGVANMDLLVILGTTAAFGLSTAVWAGAATGHLYFEAAVMVTTFVLLGRLLEQRAKHAAGRAVRGLSRLRPNTAVRLTETGEETVAVERLQPGDRVAVGPGVAFPVDGRILDGRSEADESLLTGESLPVAKEPGDTVLCGALNGDGRLILSVDQTGGATLLARMMDRVLAAQSTPAPLQRYLDRIAAVFVPIVIGIAVLTFAGWWMAGASVETALINAVSVLVIACPCALGLAIPVAVVVAMGRAAKLGLLVKDPNHLDALGQTRTVAWDKTGTLTQGALRLAGVHPGGEPDADRLLAIGAALQQGSSHPLSGPVKAAAEAQGLTPAEVTDLKSTAGQGVEGDIDGRRYRMGRLAFVGMDEAGADDAGAEGRTVTWIAREEEAGHWAQLGHLSLEDSPRDGARKAVDDLSALGISSILVSGDREAAVRPLAEDLRIPEFFAAQSPEQKADLVRGRSGAGHPVVFIGDGVNDAPALAEADVGLAMGSGTDVALDAGDITLLRPEPQLVPDAIHLARRTRAVIRQNLGWAFVYNTVAIPLAALGFLNPMVAGAAMAFSSLSVVVNALRLNKA